MKKGAEYKKVGTADIEMGFSVEEKQDEVVNSHSFEGSSGGSLIRVASISSLDESKHSETAPLIERKTGDEYILPVTNKLVRDAETGDNLSRATAGLIDSLYWAVGTQAEDLPKYFPERREQLEQALDTVIEAGLSTHVKQAFPTDRINQLFDEAELSNAQKGEVRTVLTSTHNYINFSKLQNDNAMANPSYALTDYQDAVKKALTKGLNEGYQNLAQNNAALVEQGEGQLQLQAEGGNNPNPALNMPQRRGWTFGLAPNRSGDGVINRWADAVGGGILMPAIGSLSVMPFMMLNHYVNTGHAGGFEENLLGGAYMFWNSVAIGAAVRMQGNERNMARVLGDSLSVTPGDIVLGLMTATALANVIPNGYHQYLLDAAIGVVSVKIANNLEKIPIVNRVLGTVHDGLNYAARPVRERVTSAAGWVQREVQRMVGQGNQQQLG